MMKAWIAAAGLLLPLAGMACQSGDRRGCMEAFRDLVTYRTQAIEGAFGSLFGVLPAQIPIKFVRSKDPEFARFGGHIGYDVGHHTLIIPRRTLNATLPSPLRAAAFYWPFYQNEQYREEFPIIEMIDNALWNAYLQEAAHARGLTWPHKGCTSVDVSQRLPCEMLVEGIAEHIKELRGPLFNSNRLDRIWPEDFAAFTKRLWRTDNEYRDVQRYGGILLARPLIDEFGVPRALAYMAQTPFHVEDNNLRLSARRYQDRARDALSATSATGTKTASRPAARHRYAGKSTDSSRPSGMGDVDSDGPRVQLDPRDEKPSSRTPSPPGEKL